MIRTVIFDIDDTLYDYLGANEKALAALSAYAQEQFGWEPGRAGELSVEMMHRLHVQMGDVSAYHNRAIRFQNILEEHGLPLSPHAVRMTDIYWKTLVDVSVISPGAAETMRALKQRGIRIGIGTDMTAYIQLYKLEQLGLLQYVDFGVTSEEACAEKPSEAFFACCVRKSGCSPDECLFIGDNYRKDYLGARAAGLRSLWYVPDILREKALRSADPAAEDAVAALEEVLAFAEG